MRSHLLRAINMARPSSSIRRASRTSCCVQSSWASITNMHTWHDFMACSVFLMDCISTGDCTMFFLRTPAVSTSLRGLPFHRWSIHTESLVTPGAGPVRLIAFPISLFTRVDLPTLGLPITLIIMSRSFSSTAFCHAELSLVAPGSSAFRATSLTTVLGLALCCLSAVLVLHVFADLSVTSRAVSDVEVLLLPSLRVSEDSSCSFACDSLMACKSSFSNIFSFAASANRKYKSALPKPCMADKGTGSPRPSSNKS
mmetsp:Transcript_6370/g.19263  ORF Transcript_6370/g.19263 Transcript_6370/m.19263 type:complete len:255 (+) Transcript_6370:544-1308(+)